MEAIWNLGISFIIWFQGLGNWLVVPMKFFSFLGSEEFFLFVLPVIYWCVDAGAGLRLGMIILISGGLNEILKLGMHSPRPYWFSTQVKALAAETSFGVPSGHAQIAVGLWGTAASQIKRAWAWPLAIFIIIMIGLSRLYLAVHFPHDVLLGWALGALVLWAFLKWWNPVAAWVKTKSMGQQCGLAFAISMIMIVFGLVAFGSLRSWELPAIWLTNAQQAGVDKLPNPVTLSSTITSAAVLFGMLSGLAWMNSRGGFDSQGTVQQRVLRLLPGLLGVVILYLGLKVIFPDNDDVVSYLLRYLRYTLIGAWISAGAPMVFQRFQLTSQKRLTSLINS